MLSAALSSSLTIAGMAVPGWGLLSLGLAVAGLLMFAGSLADEARRRRIAIQRILAESTLTRQSSVERHDAQPMPWVRLLAAISPVMNGRDTREVAHQLNRAGFRNASALVLYRAASSAIWLGSLAVGAVMLWVGEASPDIMQWLFLGVVPVLLATRLPMLYVAQRAEARSDALQSGLPELVDLLVICIEGGQAFDAALRRASRELGRHNPLLAAELDRVTQKIRAGAGRAETLRELAERVALDDLRELTTMIIQAERYGVALGDSLRVHSESMRLRRMQRAEEQSAKMPVKVMAPLMLCLLPALIIVLFGPAAMSLSKVFGGH